MHMTSDNISKYIEVTKLYLKYVYIVHTPSSEEKSLPRYKQCGSCISLPIPTEFFFAYAWPGVPQQRLFEFGRVQASRACVHWHWAAFCSTEETTEVAMG